MTGNNSSHHASRRIVAPRWRSALLGALCCGLAVEPVAIEGHQPVEHRVNRKIAFPQVKNVSSKIGLRVKRRQFVLACCFGGHTWLVRRLRLQGTSGRAQLEEK